MIIGVWSEANASIIIVAHVAIGDDGSTYAARICNKLQVTEGGTTYGDWYLPSKHELDLMYDNKSTVNTTATANGGVSFASDSYWNSTEYSSSDAWRVTLTNGVWYYTTKGLSISARAVRAF